MSYRSERNLKGQAKIDRTGEKPPVGTRGLPIIYIRRGSRRAISDNKNTAKKHRRKAWWAKYTRKNRIRNGATL